MKKTIIAKFNKHGNIKLGGKMWSFSKLKGNEPIATKYGDIVGTCGKYCEGCTGSCYVNASYRYPSVKDGHGRNTLAFRDDLTGAFVDLENAITRAKKKPDIIRINQSGEIESNFELLNWVLCARKFPKIRFYLYTKNYDAVRFVLDVVDDMPQNVTVLISVWHEYGLDEFNEFKKYDFIKAFVYDDGYNYAADGLNIETYCKAYDENGKLDHAVTCELCKKCFNRTSKIIGCHAH